VRGHTSGRATADVRLGTSGQAADVKLGPIGSWVTVAKGGGVVEGRGLRRVRSGSNGGDGGSRSGKGSPYRTAKDQFQPVMVETGLLHNKYIYFDYFTRRMYKRRHPHTDEDHDTQIDQRHTR